VIKDIQDLLTPFSAQARARRQMQWSSL
jgi:hypothetical protein